MSVRMLIIKVDQGQDKKEAARLVQRLYNVVVFTTYLITSGLITVIQ